MNKLIILLAACLEFAAGCGSTELVEVGPGDNADSQTLAAITGLSVYANAGCAACHCNDGQGSCSLGAPPINGTCIDPTSASCIDGRREITAEILRARLDPTLVRAVDEAPVGAADHPIKLDSSTCPENQDAATCIGERIDELQLFLSRLDRSAAQPAGDSQVTRGFDLYIRGQCVGCHLTSAQGTNQGGTGVPIAGTNPDNIFTVLTSPESSTHPARAMSADICATCQEATTVRNSVIESLVDTPLTDTDPERVLLAQFLRFIAPVPVAGVEPCENRPGDICTIAGEGVGGFNKDNVSASEARVYYPIEVSMTDWNDDGMPDLAIDDWNNHRVRIVNIDQMTQTNPSDPESLVANMIFSIAGTGKVTGADALNHPTDAEFDANGGLVMANWHNQNIYRYPKGLASGTDRDQLAGLCDLVCMPDDPSGAPSSIADSFFALPSSVAIHPDGRIFFAEAGCSRIRVLTPGTTITRVRPPQCTSEINLYADGSVTTLAGKLMTPAGGAGAPPPIPCGQEGGSCVAMNGYQGDGGLASDALFRVNNGPVTFNFGIAFDREYRYLYIADSDNNAIRRIDITANPPTIELFAGDPGDAATMTSGAGFVDDVPALQAKFRRPTNLHVGKLTGIIYVADTGNHRIRAIDPNTGMVTTVAGSGTVGFNGDNQAATLAYLNQPTGVAEHPVDGRLFIADSLNNRIRMVCPAAGCPALPTAPAP